MSDLAGSPQDAGIPKSVEWELWDKERNELVNAFPTEQEALAVKNALVESGASEDQFIVGPAEWRWANPVDDAQ